MQDSEKPAEELTEEQWAVIEAMKPPKGDVVIEVESHDRALLNALWGLQGDGVAVQERLQKGGFDPGIVHLILNVGPELKGGAVTLVALSMTRVLDFIRSLNGNDKKHSKTRIRSREFSVEAKGLTVRYKDVMDVEVEEEKPVEDENEKAAE